MRSLLFLVTSKYNLINFTIIMIPKIIHYCWLSNDPIPKKLQLCMNTWKEVLPDYKWMKWDLNTFDIDSILWTRQAYDKKKYAFAADYIRLYAIEKFGGIYLDMDVMVKKSFDAFLDYDFFTFVEYYPDAFAHANTSNIIDSEGHRLSDGAIPLGLQAAVLGGVCNNPIVRSLCSYYENTPFIKQDGSLQTDVIAPSIYSSIVESFGFIYKDQEQHINGG